MTMDNSLSTPAELEDATPATSSSPATSPSPAPDPISLESRVLPMTYTGGLLGLLKSPHRKLEEVLQRNNDDGYRLRHVLPSKAGPLFAIVQLLFLFITLFLWAPVPGETLIFERQR